MAHVVGCSLTCFSCVFEYYSTLKKCVLYTRVHTCMHTCMHTFSPEEDYLCNFLLHFSVLEIKLSGMNNLYLGEF